MVIWLLYQSRLEIKHVILAFVRVLYLHTGERLAYHLDPQLLSSVWAITADNASSNTNVVSFINNTILDFVKNCNAEIVSNADSNNVESDHIIIDPFNKSFQLSCMGAHTAPCSQRGDEKLQKTKRCSWAFPGSC